MNVKSILLCASVLLIAGAASAQSKVTSGGEKHVLVEEGTGTWCMWCPDGAQVIQERIEPYGLNANYPKAIIASFHNGSSDKMTIATDPYNNGTGYISGFPMGTVDRAPYPTNIGISRGSWPAATGARSGLTPNFDVSMVCLWDSVTRVLSIKIKAKTLVAGTGNYRINGYIVEDSISSGLGSGFAQTSANGLNSPGSTSASGSPSWFIGKGLSLASPTVYAHMDVVRKILASTATGGIWGDTAFTNPAVGDSIERSYTYTIPATINGSTCYPKYTKVIGMVQKYGATTADRAIENCIEAKVRLMWKTLPSTNVASLEPMQDIQVYPNPASSRIVVKGMLQNPSDVSVAIYNVLGQRVFANDYKAGSSMFGEFISVENLSNGTYFVNITNEGGTVTKQFTVSR
jgi:hypothetical protein